jgi:C-terminal processing protease CtpA/Prc
MPHRFQPALAVSLAAAMAITTGAGGQSAPPNATQLARLSALGRVWGTAKYFHPAPLSKNIDWDAAAVAAIPGVLDARTPADYRTAVERMLAVLDDPQTRVRSGTDPRPAAREAAVTSRSESDGTLIVAIPSFENPGATERQLRTHVAAVAKTPQVVFDLRGPAPDEVGYSDAVFERSGIEPLLPSRPTTGPGSRRRMYVGFPPQAEGRGVGNSPYWSAAYETAGRLVWASAGNLKRRTAFLVNSATDVPEVAWALLRTGEGTVVLDGPKNHVRHPLLGLSWRLVEILPMGDGLDAWVRTGEMTGASGGPLVAEHVVRSTPRGDPALAAGLAFVRNELQAKPSTILPRPAMPVDHEETYANTPYPTLPLRVLAAFRWWAAINFFYPHKAGIEGDWDTVLADSIPDLIRARDANEYVLAVAKMRARIRDSHYNNPRLFGAGSTGVVLQYVEDKPVVVAILNDHTKTTGIEIGDVIETIDDETALDRRARMAPYVSASTPHSLNHKIAGYLLKGAVGVAAMVTVRRADGREHSLFLPRVAATAGDPDEQPRAAAAGPPFRLEGDVGYADLTRLTLGQVDPMFDAFINAKGIVFDMRGYPAADLRRAMVGRLTGSFVTPPHDTLVVLSPDFRTTTWQRGGGTRLTPSTKPRYGGRTVLLIDERAQSAAEDMGLWLEAANKTTFVGSPTAGADGDITSVILPGGIRANFTGLVNYHSDGRPLQRIGLLPDIAVRPTVAGIRAGRDEVLERALKFLRESAR